MSIDTFRLKPSPAATRARKLHKEIEEAYAAEDRSQRARDHLAALSRERVPSVRRIESLRANAERVYIVSDPTGLAPPPGLLIGGKLGDLIPAAEENLAELDRQIAEAERSSDELEARD